MIFSSLVNNITLIISLGILYSFIIRKWKYESRTNQVLSGMLFGAVAVVGMMNPLIFSPGLIFDGRSIIISIAGFIGGWVTALVAALMSTAYRVWLGGPGTVMGVSVITSSAAIGVAYHYIRRYRPHAVTPLHILGFGIIVHISMLAMTLTLPSGMTYDVLSKIAVPVMLVYPAGTLLVCLILLDRESRLAAEEALRESERRFSDIIEFLPDATLVIDREGRVVAWNRAMETMTGIRKEEMLGRGNMEYALPFYGERRPILIDIALKGDPETEKQYTAIQRSGDILFGEAYTPKLPQGNAHLSATASVLRDSRGEVVGAIECIRNNTERKQVEEALRKSERQLAEIIEFLPDATFIIDQDKKIIAWNRAIEEMTRVSKQEIIGRDHSFSTVPFYGHQRKYIMDLIFEEDPDLMAKYSYVQKKGDTFLAEVFAPALHEGRGAHIWIAALPIYDSEHRIVGAIESIRDITERKQAEEALRESEERLMQAQKIARLGNWEIDLKTRTMWGSEEAFRIYGVEHDGKDPFRPLSFVQDMVHPNDRHVMDEALMALMKENRTYDQEFRIFRANDGALRWIHSQANVIRSPENKPLKVFGTLQDITERKEAEETLREREEKYRLLANNSSDVIWTMDLSGRFTYVSPSVRELSGFTPEEAMEIPLDKYLVEEDVPWVMERLHAEFAKPREERLESILVEVGQYRKDGSVLDIEVATGWLYNEQGEIIGLQGSTRDISARKKVEETGRKLEAQLRQAQKMEAIGTLAGGIAHDFNNILGAIMGYTELCKEAVSDRPKVLNNIEQVLRATKRARDLVRQILTFSRKTEQERKPIMLTPLIKEVTKFIRASLPTTIEVRNSLRVASDVIMADATQMHQVLMNLCTNAGHAMKATGGVLEIALNEITISEEDMLNPSLTRSRYLRMSVSDTGHGIPPDRLDRIFDPYFTTKEKGEGTGLGLSVVDGIVKSHGGAIRVYSEPGKGSAFHVYLPLIEERTGADGEAETASLPGGSETILFVDDEKMLAQIGKLMLENLGYKVVAETDPTRAIELFREGRDAFDLVITDKAMPHVSGFDLAAEIRGIRENIPIILCSGLLEKEDADRLQALGISRFITKPISKSELAGAVREVLDGRNAS